MTPPARQVAALLLAVGLAPGCGGGNDLPLPGPDRAPATLDGDAIADIGRILRFEDSRAFDEAAFRRFATSGTVEVRRRAALAAGRIGDPAAVPFLLERLRTDRDPEVRADAAFALGELSTPSEAVLDGLLAAAPRSWIPVRDEDVSVAVEVIAALGKLGGPRARRAVRDALREVHPARGTRLRAVAAEALLTVWKFDDGAGNVLAAARYLDSPDPELRWRAVYALARGGDPSAIARVLGIPDDPEHRVRAYIARTLSSDRADSAGLADGARAWLVGALDDPHPHVRINAVRALGGYGDRAPLDRLTQRLADRDGNVGVAAARVLSGLGPDAAPALEDALHTGRGRPTLRGAILAALANADPERALPVIREWAADPARRFFAARALTPLEPDTAVRLAGAILDAGPAAAAVAALDVARSIAADSAAPAPARTAAGQILDRGRRSGDPVIRAAARPDSEAGPAPPAEVREPAFYEELVRRWVVPALAGDAAPRVLIESPHGDITVELLAAEAPLTVHNFLSLAERGYFDRGLWHRVVPNFVLQDGAPGGYGSGGPGWSIRDEINRVRYGRGMVGMALSGPDTGGSQWFIAHSPQPHLDGGYTVFGRVVDGMRAADAILEGDPIPAIRVDR